MGEIISSRCPKGFLKNNSSTREDARGLQGHLHKTNKKAKEVTEAAKLMNKGQ